MAVARAEELPSGRWRGVATIRGKRQTMVWPTQGEALVWADTEMRKAAGVYRSGDRRLTVDITAPTLKKFAPVYLNGLTVEPGTISSYKSYLAPAIERWDGVPMDEILYLEVREWVAEMSRRRGPDHVGPRTIQARVKQLRALFKVAIKAKVVDGDPTEDVPLPKIPDKPFRIIEPDAEETRLLEAARPEGLLLPCLLALDGGLRWGEVYGLHGHRVNALRQEVMVTTVEVRETGQLRDYPKGKLWRPVPMTDRLTEATTALVERLPRASLLFSRDGAPVKYDYFKGVWKRVVKAAELDPPYPTFHDLRHTFGTRLAAASTPIEEIAALMGHVDIETTRKYIHAASPKVREAWLRHALEGKASPVVDIQRVRTDRRNQA